MQIRPGSVHIRLKGHHPLFFDMYRHRAVLRPLLLACGLIAFATPAHADCLLSKQDPVALERWKAGGFAMDDASSRRQRALALTDCLGEADPFLRDGIAFEALSTWMRGKQLNADTLRLLERRLRDQLDDPDSDGFRKPFAALVLSEVARADRMQPWMTAEERTRMAASAAVYLSSVRDYRGYVDGEGWRHGVAHGADWALQLVMNKNLEPSQGLMLLSAISAQVMPADGHAYAFGEPARLARPVAHAAVRGILPRPALEAWLGGLVASLGPRPSGGHQATWWMRRADLESFLHALATLVVGDASPVMVELSQTVREAIGGLP